MTEPNIAVRHADPAMLADVRSGLERPQKELSPKYFYDHRGSMLFEEISRLPEYYLTRTERTLLERWAPTLVGDLRIRSLVELGAGSAEKTRIILDAMQTADRLATYVPIDVSEAFLAETARRLRAEYPGLRVLPIAADITDEVRLLPQAPPGPVLYALLGSTIGNFYPAEAVRLVRRVRDAMAPEDGFLLGVDLRKDVAVLEAAYNDRGGVTADFNRNALRVLNAELGADFDAEAFDHRAFYDRVTHRIEMHLVSRLAQEVVIPGIGRVALALGESIRTEISAKYDRPSVATLFAAAGLRIADWRSDPHHDRFALAVGVLDRP
jgi:L-histidine N-alpha-methyltransferase